MSISLWFRTQISLIKKDIVSAYCARTIVTGKPALCEVEIETEQSPTTAQPKRVEHPPEQCIKYMSSEAYKITYGDKPVWHVYVRNFKGTFPPKTRKSCWRGQKLSTNNPCPICRDQYLLPHYCNVKLLEQFISPSGGQILDSKKTGVCQKQQWKLLAAIKKAQNYGLLKCHIPARVYDYSAYIKK